MRVKDVEIEIAKVDQGNVILEYARANPSLSVGEVSSRMREQKLMA